MNIIFHGLKKYCIIRIQHLEQRNMNRVYFITGIYCKSRLNIDIYLQLLQQLYIRTYLLYTLDLWMVWCWIRVKRLNDYYDWKYRVGCPTYVIWWKSSFDTDFVFYRRYRQDNLRAFPRALFSYLIYLSPERLAEDFHMVHHMPLSRTI